MKWKLCSNFSFQYFIEFTWLIIESATGQNNNALCSPLSRGDDDVSCPIRFATESSINRLRRNARGARVTTVHLTGRLHMTMMIGQRGILRAWCRVYRCLQQAALSKVRTTSVRGAPSREESPRGHVDRQRCVHPSARRRCDGRWECILKPANCYRFIDTNIHVHNTHARKKEGSRRMIRLPAGVRSRETERESPNFWLRKFIVSPLSLRYIAWHIMHVHQRSWWWIEGESKRINRLEITDDKQDSLIDWSIDSLYFI